MAKKLKNGLTEQQYRFCLEYIKDLNGRQAAIRAGYSERGAEVQASKLLTISKVIQIIRELNEKRMERTLSEADRVILELKRLAFFDPRELFDEDGNLVPIKDLPAEVAAAIGGIDLTLLRSRSDNKETEHTKKIKIVDKNRALENLGKHHALFIERHEHDISKRLEAALVDKRRKAEDLAEKVGCGEE